MAEINCDLENPQQDLPELSTPRLKQMKFCADSNPAWRDTMLLGFQHFLVQVGIFHYYPYVIAIRMGGDMADRIQVMRTLMLLSGIHTLLESWFGSRMPIMIAPSLAYLSSLDSLIVVNPGNRFNSHEERFVYDMRVTQGSLLISSLLPIFLGYSRIWERFTRYFAPVAYAAVVPAIAANFTIHLSAINSCWGNNAILLVLFFIFQCGRHITRLAWLKRMRCYVALVSLCLAWGIVASITQAGGYTDTVGVNYYLCKTRLSEMVSSTPWFRIPYPFQWGTPIIHWSSIFGMMGAVLVASVESTVGTYCGALLGNVTSLPPPRVTGRSIGLQGIVQFLIGCFGGLSGTATSFPSLGLVGATRVGSRRVLQVAASMMIFASIVGKVGAIFFSIPTSIYGVLYFFLHIYIAMTGKMADQHISSSGRNFNLKAITLTVAVCVFKSQYHIKTKQLWFNNIVNSMLSSGSFVAVVIALFCDQFMNRKKRDNIEGRWSSSDETNYKYPWVIRKIFNYRRHSADKECSNSV